jgi:hypothetical protein
LPSPSSYLQSSLSRWNDRETLIRRDVEMMLEGLKVKGLLLDDLRQKVRKHREEDAAQLTEARLATWGSWEERLKRLEEWMASAAALGRSSANLRAWRDSAIGFDRAAERGQKFAVTLERKAAKYETKTMRFIERLQPWSDRLRLKEADLREFAERQAVKTEEIQVSKSRKQPYLEFLFSEREEEGRIALELKIIRTTTNRVLKRLARADKWVMDRAEANPAHFEARKIQLLEMWSPFHARYRELREAILRHALDFEEGRRRLRWIYEQVQRMRVIQESVPVRRPFLERFFRVEE